MRKKKEERIAKLLKDNDIQFDREFTVPFSCFQSEGKCARIDFVITKEWGYILLEVDENQHSWYDYFLVCYYEALCAFGVLDTASRTIPYSICTGG